MNLESTQPEKSDKFYPLYYGLSWVDTSRIVEFIYLDLSCYIFIRVIKNMILCQVFFLLLINPWFNWTKRSQVYLKIEQNNNYIYFENFL